ncbi:hypothetical protein [Janthinobacterium sp.]|uniref:hypothetical protein n=1 Tax=Janthinobacterium sp. TaxID=1871054 RepID=UPI0028A25447|nr:hypothetical protein [Janthinobacterium sp.]
MARISALQFFARKLVQHGSPVVANRAGAMNDHAMLNFYRYWRLIMTVEPWDSEVELEVQERAREIEAVGGALLNNARTLVGIHFDSAFQNDPAVIAAVFQGLVALHGPVK